MTKEDLQSLEFILTMLLNSKKYDEEQEIYTLKTDNITESDIETLEFFKSYCNKKTDEIERQEEQDIFNHEIKSHFKGIIINKKIYLNKYERKILTLDEFKTIIKNQWDITRPIEDFLITVDITTLNFNFREIEKQLTTYQHFNDFNDQIDFLINFNDLIELKEIEINFELKRIFAIITTVKEETTEE